MTFPQGSSIHQHESLAMILPQGSSIHQHGIVTTTQHQGSFIRSEGYMEVFPVQGSYFNNQGSSPRVQGFIDHTSRPPVQTYMGPNVFQDQGSSRRQSWRSSEIHKGDFIPIQTIASSGYTVIPDISYPRYTSGIPTSN
ncbi:hypothetical protein Hanom_Chr06g00548791 [Helianthus anomalus]